LTAGNERLGRLKFLSAGALAALLLSGADGAVALGQAIRRPNCGASGSAAVRDTASEGGPVPIAFTTVADIPLPGSATRFDYQSLDDAGGRLYLAHMGAGQVIAVDTRRRSVVGVVGGLPRVTGVRAVPELQRLYTSPTGLHAVAIIDTKRLKVVGRVGPIGFPDGIAYAPTAKKVFVSDESGDGELVIDAARDRSAGTIPLGGEAGNTIFDPGSGCILVAVQTRNEVVAIDPAGQRVVGRYRLAGAARPHGLALDAARRLLFVANEENATLLVVDLRTMRVTGRHPVGPDPDVLAFDPGWRRLYVAAESGSITAFDERAGGLVRVGALELPHAHSVAVSAATHLLYVPLADVGGRPVLRVLAATPPATSARSCGRPTARLFWIRCSGRSPES
jgi:DNA-binding beta-propeller fold protein YncE